MNAGVVGVDRDQGVETRVPAVADVPLERSMPRDQTALALVIRRIGERPQDIVSPFGSYIA
jgi:hypothetical protein